ncbi:MAG: hypothetical protein WA369_09780 [Candidatus Acidiferrales bacterium]
MDVRLWPAKTPAQPHASQRSSRHHPVIKCSAQQQLRIEYRDATAGLRSKSPSNVVTVDLASHTPVVQSFTA